MGCGQTKVEPVVDQPDKLKHKTQNDQDLLMGNVIPKEYIEDKSALTRKRNSSIHSIEELEKQQANQQQAQKDQNEENQEKKKRQNKKAQNKLRGGGDEGEEIYENFKKINRKILKNDLVLIVNSLKSHFVFYALSDSELEHIVHKMFYCEVGNGDFIFQQGDKASSYFILEKGKVEILINEVPKKQLPPGASFGELALLYNAPRSASVKCIGNCGFWGIDRSTFRQTIEELVQKEYDMNRKFMESVSFFNFLTADQKDAIARNIISTKYQLGQVIVNEGDNADSFYVIKQGVVSVWKGGKELRKLQQGDSFGEQALYVSTTRGATVKADGEVILLSLGRDNINNILGDKVQVILYNNLTRWAFEKSKWVSKLTKIQQEKINNKSKILNQKKDDVIFQAQSLCDKLVVVLEGSLVKKKTNETVAGRGQLFGDEYLSVAMCSHPIDDDIIMLSDGVIREIKFRNIQKAIGDNIENVIKKNVNSHEVKMAKEEEKIDYSHIQLEKLIYIKKLGSGQFGSVFLVRNKDQKDLYALKSVSKAQIIEQNLEKHLIQEKTVLETINFKFIMKFYRTFKDNNSVYFLTEFISGMELFDAIREIGLLSTTDSQYYIGSLILGMEYLHGKHIIYRDIKPENIMVNSEGHMLLIDMGTAKILNVGKYPDRTFTIIGTPHYMAPEIIRGKGYTYSIDLWSIGICLYEFMCGAVPYAEEAEDPYEIYEEIMKSEVKYPSFMKDKKAKRLIDQLLSKVPEMRLGGSYAALKANTWFDNFDWDRLYTKELEPPYKPPSDKILNDKQIEKIANQQKMVIDEIKQEQAANKMKYKKELARDQNWDKDF